MLLPSVKTLGYDFVTVWRDHYKSQHCKLLSCAELELSPGFSESVTDYGLFLGSYG